MNTNRVRNLVTVLSFGLVFYGLLTPISFISLSRKKLRLGLRSNRPTGWTAYTPLAQGPPHGFLGLVVFLRRRRGIPFAFLVCLLLVPGRLIRPTPLGDVGSDRISPFIYDQY
jgi:hypothetical protein